MVHHGCDEHLAAESGRKGGEWSYIIVSSSISPLLGAENELYRNATAAESLFSRQQIFWHEQEHRDNKIHIACSVDHKGRRIRSLHPVDDNHITHTPTPTRLPFLCCQSFESLLAVVTR